jgi:hypothetical protein
MKGGWSKTCKLKDPKRLLWGEKGLRGLKKERQS